MAFSSIATSKFGNCYQCDAKDTNVVKVKKDLFCLNCHRNNKAKAQLQKQKVRNQVRSLKNTPQNIENKIENELHNWFKDRMSSLYPQCENCGAKSEHLLMEQYSKKWKSCQAHLLPKRHFDSIKTHPLIGMVLGSGYSGMCNCHDEYDSNWEKASKMNIWKEVVSRFKVLYPLIPQSEHRFIPQILLQTLNT